MRVTIPRYYTIKPPPSPSTTPPPPPPVYTTATQRRTARLRAHPHYQSFQSNLNSLLTSLNSSAAFRSTQVRDSIKALELQARMQQAGKQINAATGYEQIELLRSGVALRETSLQLVRQDANQKKQIYTERVRVRSNSQREVNDLLSRKSSWSNQDVSRFTELVREDHDNERHELNAKLEMELSEEAVEKAFSDLMQGILERYHEEQVWSDKIRSLSTYGSLAITSLNVLIFIITILLVEPWKRKRLVEGVEARLRESTTSSNEATTSSITALQSLLHDAQAKLDRLLTTPSSPSPSSHTPTAALIPDPKEETIEREESGGTAENTEAAADYLTDKELMLIEEVEIESTLIATEVKKKERETELWLVGIGGATVGVVVSVLISLLHS